MIEIEQEQITWHRKDKEETIQIEATITTNYKTGDKQIIKGLRKEMNLMLSRLSRDLANAKQRDKEKDAIQVRFGPVPGQSGNVSTTTWGKVVDDVAWSTKNKARSPDDTDS